MCPRAAAELCVCGEMALHWKPAFGLSSVYHGVLLSIGQVYNVRKYHLTSICRNNRQKYYAVRILSGFHCNIGYTHKKVDTHTCSRRRRRRGERERGRKEEALSSLFYPLYIYHYTPHAREQEQEQHLQQRRRSNFRQRGVEDDIRLGRERGREREWERERGEREPFEGGLASGATQQSTREIC